MDQNFTQSETQRLDPNDGVEMENHIRKRQLSKESNPSFYYEEMVYEDTLGLSNQLYETLNHSLIILSQISIIAAYTLMTTPFNELQDQGNKAFFITAVCTQFIVNIFYILDLCIEVRKNNKKVLIQFLCGPVSFIINVIFMSTSQRLSFYGIFLQTFPILGLQFSKRLWTDCYLFFRKTYSLLMTMLIFYFTLSFIAMFIFGSDQHFQTYRNSIFSMLQIITLDNWGQIASSFIETQGPFSVLYIVFCIFILNYFYLNLLTAFMIDIVREKQQERNIRAIQMTYGIEFKACSQIKVQQFQTEANEVPFYANPTLFERIILGRIYQYGVIALTFFIIGLTIISDQITQITSVEGILLNFLDDIIYSAHFFIIIFSKSTFCQYERKDVTMMLLHFIAGPGALLMDLLELFVASELSYGSFCCLLKILTTPMVKGVVIGTFRIFQFIAFPFITIFTLMAIFSLIFMQFFSHSETGQLYFSNFYRSILTCLQLSTLDNWNSEIIIAQQDNTYSMDSIIITVLIVFFIFITNTIFINVIIAISCEYFQIIVPMNKSLVRDLNFQAKRQVKSIIIRLTQLGVAIPFLEQNNEYKDTYINNNLMNYAVDVILDKYTNEELDLTRRLIVVQDQYLDEEDKKKKKVLDSKSRSIMLDSKTSIFKEEELTNEFITVFYKGRNAKIPLNRINIWDNTDNQSLECLRDSKQDQSYDSVSSEKSKGGFQTELEKVAQELEMQNLKRRKR